MFKGLLHVSHVPKRLAQTLRYQVKPGLESLNLDKKQEQLDQEDEQNV